jgi:hypothetical protein
MGVKMLIEPMDEFAGLRRELEIGLCLAPTRVSAVPAAKALAAYLDGEPGVAVRLAGLACDDSRVLITLGVCLGSVDEIKTADPVSRAAVLFIQRIVDELAAYDPAFVTLPAPASAEARLALHVMARNDVHGSAVLAAVGHLASVH